MVGIHTMRAKIMSNLLRPFLMLLALAVMTPFAQAQTAYKIAPGDVLQLEVLEDPSLNRSLLVLPDGNVTVPQGGTIHAAGFSVAEVQAAVVAALTPNFAQPPTVNLAVGQLAPRLPATGGTATAARAGLAVYVLGEVAKPGRVDIEPGTTLLQFLAQSGGLTNFAATKRIQLRRTDASGKEQIYLFNYQNVMAGAQAPVIYLQKGDVIIVPQRKLFE
jgi:polysaccharide export outer membrane protein